MWIRRSARACAPPRGGTGRPIAQSGAGRAGCRRGRPGGRAASSAAQAFRAGVTDRWGSDRWKRLARATGLGETALRAGAMDR